MPPESAALQRSRGFRGLYGLIPAGSGEGVAFSESRARPGFCLAVGRGASPSDKRAWTGQAAFCRNFRNQQRINMKTLFL